ncbi:hypothetical protein ACKWTF_007661 [Chironomus riparius]
MNHVKQQQKYQYKKPIPILCEQIIEMREDDPDRTNIIYFQTPLTSLNRGIIDHVKKIKKNSKSIERYWLMRGSFHIDLRNQEKFIRIDSVEQLKFLKSTIPMDTE